MKVGNILVLVTYDVNTGTSDGRRRLRQVAKACSAHGQRVQNSVFECILDNAQYRIFVSELEHLIDKETDSLRIYTLGNNYKEKVHHCGAKPSFDMEGTLFL